MEERLPANNWAQFEQRVANIFRALGAEVQRDVGVAGNQIDILARERTATGTVITTAVECKALRRPVGVDLINAYAGLAYLLRQRKLIDRAVLVTTVGFTTAARGAAEQHGIELLEIADLEQRLAHARGVHTTFGAITADANGDAVREITTEHGVRSAAQKRAFVLMPFAPGFQDIYILGIREVGEKIGVVVERADSVEHNGEIMAVVRDKIRVADVVIADITGRNANVFYEVGYSHALERPTILIARQGEALPFDVQAVNCIFYETIVELRDRLEKRLRQTLSL